MDNKEFSIVVGLDFGTTGCGIAFGLRDGTVYMDQDFSQSSGGEKIPTCLLFSKDRKFKSFGVQACQDYVNSQNNGDLFFQYFKMSLYKGDPLSTALNGETMKTSDLICETLSQIKEYAIDFMTKQFNYKMNSDKLLWVLTVPAIWSPKAKSIVHTAAIESKLINKDRDKFLIALEPECASLYIRSTPSAKVRLKAGDIYVVADLGGGTADITAHKVIDENTVCEVYRASGGDWGSSYINKQFEHLLESLFGKDHIQRIKKEMPLEWYRLECEFEITKRSFTKKSEAAVVKITVVKKYMEKIGKDVEELIDEKNRVEFKSTPIRIRESDDGLVLNKEAFEKLLLAPVIDKITKHLSELLEKPQMAECRHLFLAGGMSKMEHVTKGINDAVSKNNKVDVKVAFRPHVAVVGGAVHFGLNPSAISSRISLRTYGCAVKRKYDEKNETHKRAPKDTCDGTEYAGDIFDCFVTVGTPVENNFVVKRTYIPCSIKDSYISIQIYESTLEKVELCTDKECLKAGSFSIDVPQEGAREDREITLSMKFGATEIELIAVNKHGQQQKTIIEFYTNTVTM